MRLTVCFQPQHGELSVYHIHSLLVCLVLNYHIRIGSSSHRSNGTTANTLSSGTWHTTETATRMTCLPGAPETVSSPLDMPNLRYGSKRKSPLRRLCDPSRTSHQKRTWLLQCRTDTWGFTNAEIPQHSSRRPTPSAAHPSWERLQAGGGPAIVLHWSTQILETPHAKVMLGRNSGDLTGRRSGSLPSDSVAKGWT